jgi:hypothetical protein
MAKEKETFEELTQSARGGFQLLPASGRATRTCRADRALGCLVCSIADWRRLQRTPTLTEAARR